MKFIIRLFSVILPVSLALSIFSITSANQSTFSAQTDEREPIASERSFNAGLPVKGISIAGNIFALSPEVRPTEGDKDEPPSPTTTAPAPTTTTPPPPSPPHPDSGGSISGYVYQSDGNTPISNARIYAYLYDGHYGYEAYTGENGSYTISQITAGSYRVSASASGYLGEYYNGTYDYNGVTPVAVADSVTTSGVNFTLDTGGSISGHVYQADGVTPVEGASIHASSTGKNYSYSQSDYSDSDGSYLISMLLPGNYRLSVSAKGYIPEYYNGAYGQGEATLVPVTLSNTTPDINFTLDTGGSISGHVYKADGVTPVEGAQLYAWISEEGYSYSRMAYSGSGGSYLISTLMPGNYRIRVDAAGYIYEYYQDTQIDNEATLVQVTMSNNTPDIDFTLDTGGSISGHVYQADGATPIADADIYASLTGETYSYSQSAYSTSDGNYFISPLVPGKYRLSILAEDYIPEYYDGAYESGQSTLVTVTLSNTTPNIDFTLDDGGSISGHVYQSDGVTPIENAYVYASLAGEGYSYSQADYSDSEGSYHIATLRPGNYWIRVSASGYIYEYYQGTQIDDEATLVQVSMSSLTPGIDFTLEIGGSISGHVYQADGVTPVPKAYVEAILQLSDYYYSMSGRTDSSGSYTIPVLPSGSYIVETSASGYLEEYYSGAYSSDDATLVNVTAPQDTPAVDFTLDTGGSISGHIYQADGTTPIANAKIYPHLYGDIYSIPSIISASDGSYLFSNLASGNYIIEVSAEGYIREYYNSAYSYSKATLIPVTVSSNTPSINFTLDTGGSISGHIYQADGVTPISGAYVDADLTGASYFSGGDTTSSDGACTIDALPAGNYRVRTEASGYIAEYYYGTCDYDEATLVPVTLTDNTPDIDFTMDTGGSISGHVYQPDGITPVEGAYIDADLIGASYDYSDAAYAGADGSYTVSGLPPGSYRLRASAEGYITEYYGSAYDYNKATPVVVTEASNTPDIDFLLETGGSISGHVYQANGETPISNAHIYASLTESTYSYSDSTTTGSDGSYTVSDLPPGKYRVYVHVTGYISEYYSGTYDYDQATPVKVVDSANTPGIDFTLDTGGSISGNVYQEDGVTPISGAMVSADLIGSSSGYGGGDVTAADGSYTISQLPEGVYRVWATASGYLREYYDGVYDSDEAKAVAVADLADTPGIDFSLNTGGSISGHVYQSDGTTPVADAEVDALGPHRSENTTTSADGSYTVGGLYSDTYRVRVTASGYIPTYYDGVYSSNNATPVSVTAPQDTPDIDFTLETGGSISGHIYQMDGVTPVSEAEVYASSVAGDYSISQRAYSALNGSYTISGLLPGNYRLEVSAAGYIEEYYNSAYAYSEATLVPVSGTNTTPDIDFTLDTGGSISGHVYQEDGETPISNAHIYASLTGASYGYGRSATTGYDGSYTIGQLPSGNYRIEAYASGYLDEYYNGVYDSGQATLVGVADPADTTGIDFTLDTGSSISGHVYQLDGTTPIANAEVYASGTRGYGEATTGADGSYVILTLYSDNYRVRVRAAGYVTTYYNGVFNSNFATLVAVIATQDTPDIDFALDTGGAISGHVYQADGVTPVSDAYVYASLQGEEYSYSQTTSSASDGSYTISALAPGNYRISVSADGYIDEYYDGTYESKQATLVSVALSNTTLDIDFTLDTGGSISGHVYQADGVTPVSNANVYARLQFSSYYYTQSDYTDSNGKYIIPVLPSGKYTVMVTASGYLTEYYSGTYDLYNSTLVPVTDPGDTPGIDFTLDTGGSISGHVYQMDGVTPIYRAYVSASLREASSSYSAGSYSTSDGSYLISALAPGNYQLRVSADSYIQEYYNGTYDANQATLVPVTQPNTTPGIDFTLDTGGSISGHVYQADGSTPISGAYILAQSISGGKGSSAYTASDGSYTVSVLPTGRYKIHARAEGYSTEYYNGAFDSSSAAMVSVIAPDDTPGININLDQGGSISGQVYQADGVTPISNAEILVVRMGNTSHEVTPIQWIDVSQDGGYTVSGLSPGSYQVSARAPGFIAEYYGGGYQSSEATPVSVAVSADTAGIDFRLDTGATISGHVYQPDGVTPIAGAQVGVSITDIDYVTTSPDGSYTLQGLPTGSYQVYAYKYGYLSEYYESAYYSGQATQVSATAPGATSNIDFTLDNKGGSISGHVYQADGITPINHGFRVNAIPMVSGTRPPVPTAIPAPVPDLLRNDYLIQDLPPGEYKLSISAPGYVSEYYNGAFSLADAALVVVNIGTETTDIDFTLDKGGSISGHVYQSDGNTPVRGATVSAVLTGATVSANLTAAALSYDVQTTTDYEGSYTLSGLTSGSYKVRAQAGGYAGEYYSDVYLSEEASPVSVMAPDNTPGIDFLLERRGDANKDGKVNMGDVTRVELIILGLASSTPLADANGDGKINMGDVTRIELDILGF